MKSPIILLVSLLGFAACSPSSQQDENKARSADELIALIKQQQSPDSLKNPGTLMSYTRALAEFVDNYPDHAQYEPMLFQAATHFHEQKDFKRAAHYYARYAEGFTGTRSSAEACFGAGYVYNNNLNELDSAKKYYQLFIAGYPGHHLISAAETELEFLGKTPKEMLDAIQEKNKSTDSTQVGKH